MHHRTKCLTGSFFQEVNHIGRTLNLCLHAVIRIDAHQPETKSRIDPFFISPFRRGKTIGHLIDIFSQGSCNPCKNTGRAGIIDTFPHMPHRRQIRLQEFLQAFPGFVIRRSGTVAQLHQRKCSTAVGKNQYVILQQHISYINNRPLIQNFGIITPHHIDNSQNPAALYRIRQRLHTSETLMYIFHRKSHFRFYLIRRNKYRNSLPFLKTLNCSFYNPLCNLLCLVNIGMMMVICNMFRPGKPCRITGRYNRRFITSCHLHDGWKYILYICHPEIQRTGAEHKFSGYRVRKRNNPCISVHRRETGTTDTIEADALRTFFFRKVLILFLKSRLYNLAYQKGKMTVNRNIDISFL